MEHNQNSEKLKDLNIQLIKNVLFVKRIDSYFSVMSVWGYFVVATKAL